METTWLTLRPFGLASDAGHHGAHDAAHVAGARGVHLGYDVPGDFGDLVVGELLGQVAHDDGELGLFLVNQVGAVPLFEGVDTVVPLLGLLLQGGDDAVVVQLLAVFDLLVVYLRAQVAENAGAGRVAAAHRCFEVFHQLVFDRHGCRSVDRGVSGRGDRAVRGQPVQGFVYGGQGTVPPQDLHRFEEGWRHLEACRGDPQRAQELSGLQA